MSMAWWLFIGNTIRLVPDSNVKNSGVPYDPRNNARGDQVVTRVIWLENTNPNDLILHYVP